MRQAVFGTCFLVIREAALATELVRPLIQAVEIFKPLERHLPAPKAVFIEFELKFQNPRIRG